MFNTGQLISPYTPTSYVMGTCSLCGGDVVKSLVHIQSMENNFAPARGFCQKCGALENLNPGPVIPMIK